MMKEQKSTTFSENFEWKYAKGNVTIGAITTSGVVVVVCSH